MATNEQQKSSGGRISPSLCGLQPITKTQVAACVDRDSIEAAQRDIATGAHVGQVCVARGINDSQQRVELERFAMACPHITDELIKSGSGAHVAAKFGITDPALIEDMRIWGLSLTVLR